MEGIMVDAGIAETMGLTAADAENLINGHALPSVADAFGVPLLHLQSYIDTGSVTQVFAERLGQQVDAAEDLGIRLGKRGRIGLIMGRLLAG
jgi:hypothetical protein